jgi:phosphoenolpyruvate synthase/pyruvate phosphate dikinase
MISINRDKLLPEIKGYALDIPVGILKEIAFFGLNIEKEFNHPQDIEFAIKNKNIYILQSRPINIITK